MSTKVRKTVDTPSFRDSYNAGYRESTRRLIEKIAADPTISPAQKEYKIAKLREDLKTGPVQDSCV